MCGARLEPAVSPVAIDDNDPLDLEAPAYSFDDRARSAGQATADFRERDRERELVRDSKPVSRTSSSRAGSSAISLENPPPDTVQEEALKEKEEREAPHRVSGIGGPSFLGLGYEGSNSGFVYDKPRNDGFVYDTDGEAPEYLLEEAPRGVSWRAWGLVILLLIGGGLGYIQWRANHNEGPDIASILAGNGAAMDPNHPVITPESPKPPAQKPNPPANDASSPASAKDQKADSAADKSADADSGGKASTADNGSNSKTASSKSEDKSGDENASDETSKTPEKPGAAASAKAKEPKDSDESAKPESDEQTTKATKRNRPTPAPVVEKTPLPKSLGEKDPLIIQAEKYIQGRGVRQNCSTGINLLRQAMSEGNPEADVKIGALYWSGTCVTQNNVTAYQWFSRAHSLEPRNRWIERSRNSLWASMSADEKRRISY
jgi:hypothetical protein